MKRIAYLGPAGTFSEEALHAAADGALYEPVEQATIFDAIAAVGDGHVELAFVPIENSIEGSVRPTLDALARRDIPVTIAGEYDHRISASLIARDSLRFGEITEVLSHPQPIAQCARFLRENLPAAKLRSTTSTAEAIREVSEGPRGMAAIGPPTTASTYGCLVLAEDIADELDNITRFVWIVPEDTPISGPEHLRWQTSLVFAELGDDHPGALVNALKVFSDRSVNLNRIESRPLRLPGAAQFASYMFFLNLDGGLGDPTVTESINALRGHAEWVRMLGSYPLDAPGIPGGTLGR